MSGVFNPFGETTVYWYKYVSIDILGRNFFFLIFILPSLEELDTDMKRAFQALSGATRRFDAYSTFIFIFVFKHDLLF